MCARGLTVQGQGGSTQSNANNEKHFQFKSIDTFLKHAINFKSFFLEFLANDEQDFAG